MKLSRLVIPTIAAIAMVLLGTLTYELVPTGLIVASEAHAHTDRVARAARQVAAAN